MSKSSCKLLSTQSEPVSARERKEDEGEHPDLVGRVKENIRSHYRKRRKRRNTNPAFRINKASKQGFGGKFRKRKVAQC